jgi:DNA-binding transcriptional LysR family regulator
MSTSQPTASRFLGELEREIGFLLFIRAHGKLTPTPEAHAFHEEVARSFRGLERIQQAAENIANFRSDQLRIASISSLGLGLLVPTIPKFCARYVGIKIALNVCSFEEVVSNVATNQCEVGFVAYPVNRPGIVEQHLIRANAVCVLPSHHELVSRDVITPQDIGNSPFISLGHDIPSGKRIDEIFNDAGIKRNMAVETQTASVACALVAQGAGVAILDPFTAYATRTKGMAIRPFEPPAPFEFRVIFRSDSPPPRAISRFIEETRNWLAESPLENDPKGDPMETMIKYQN